MSLCSFETRKEEVCHESGITDAGFQESKVTQKERERKRKKREWNF